MPDVDITIGGRVFQVACQSGEEQFVKDAALMLDAEAAPLAQQMGRMPEARMLLMAGLMLADRTASLQTALQEAQAKIEALAARPDPEPERIEVPVEVRIEVPVMPVGLGARLGQLAQEAEAIADAAEERAAALADMAED